MKKRDTYDLSEQLGSIITDTVNHFMQLKGIWINELNQLNRWNFQRKKSIEQKVQYDY